MTPALAALVALAPVEAVAAPERRFITDDYEGTRAAALARKVPLFVEVWAPW
jgi:hypothetical protein